MIKRVPPRRDSVRSLERGLALLELVNEEGGVKPAEAAKHLKLPRPTAHRLLATLEELGYVRRSASDNRFLVTIRARRLSGGYDTDVQLSEVVGPVLSNLLHHLVWPINIATYRGGMMVVRETTHERSPLSIDRAMIGREVPILRTASGRVYLSFCAEEERREIIEYLTMLDDPEDESYLNERALEEMIATVRRQGYAARMGESFVPKTSSIALPILVDGHARGAITVVWLTSAMLPSRAIKQFVPPLREAAAVVAKKLGNASVVLPELNPAARRAVRL